MQSIFDDRVWLAWLVKVRILILTVLLGIELVISQFTPVLSRFVFLSIPFCCRTRSRSSTCSPAFLGGVPHPGVLQVISDLLWSACSFTSPAA